MKKIKLLCTLFMVALVSSCRVKPIEGATHLSFPTIPTLVPSTLEPSTAEEPTGVVAPITIEPTVAPTLTITTTNVEKTYTLAEINDIGKALENDTTGIKVKFNAMYVKTITDNNDHLMLFVDNDSYLCVRVESEYYTKHLQNRYKYCYYDVEGVVSKKNNSVEVVYENLTNSTTTPSTYDYSNVTSTKSSIKEVYDEIKTISLNEKYNGVGKIVTFRGVVLATDRDDANSKAVLYDNNHVITVINDKKICDAKEDLNKEFEITGIVNVLKGQPAVLALDFKSKAKTINVDYSNVCEVTPSYFSKWYHTSKNISDPSYDDFAKLYSIRGYVNIDNSRTSSYYFGLTDNANGNLSDSGTTKSIKGVYLMNYQNQKEKTSYNEKIVDAYNNEDLINVYASLYQFDTSNHGWKMFMVDDTLKTAK